MEQGQSGNRAIGQGAAGGNSFKRMELWQKAQDLAVEVFQLVARLPKSQSANAIGNQLMRAAGSIGANVAEGYGRFSQAAYLNHLSIARGSAFEVESWLDLLKRTGLRPADEVSKAEALCSSVQGMITTRMKSLNGAKQSYAREERVTYEVEPLLPDC